MEADEKISKKVKKEAQSPDHHFAINGGGDSSDYMADEARRRKAASGGAGERKYNCQVDKCMADLSEARQYHRRHRVCEHHSKAKSVTVSGTLQRFCQQCSRFHELSEFDEAKRSCRTRLAGHNERRRRSSAETQAQQNSTGGDAEGAIDSAKKLKELGNCSQVDHEMGRIQLSVNQDQTPTLKQFKIR